MLVVLQLREVGEVDADKLGEPPLAQLVLTPSPADPLSEGLGAQRRVQRDTSKCLGVLVSHIRCWQANNYPIVHRATDLGTSGPQNSSSDLTGSLSCSSVANINRC